MKRILMKDSYAVLCKRSFRYTLLVWSFMLAPMFPDGINAATIRVPADAPTIQGGINAAMNGDTVLVAPGTYFENISFGGKAITVKSEQGPEVTIMNAVHSNDSAVSFVASEGLSSILSGFTITRGNASFGGGIAIRGASPTIVNNIIYRNQACGGGAGIFMLQSGAVIDGNEIIENLAQQNCTAMNGVGIFVFDAVGAQISGNRISSNSAALGGGILVSGRQQANS